MDEQRYIEEQYDEIDIMELVRKLLKSWKLIAIYCGVAAVIGLVVGFSIPKEYTVNAKLAPEVASKSGGGQLSSLAAMAGINLGSMSSTDAVSPDLYPEIVSSTPFMVDLFSLPVEFEYKDETVRTDLYDYMKNYTKSPWWGAVINAPFKALSWFMGLFREKVEPVEGYAELNPSALTNEQQKMVEALTKSISVMVDKKTLVISASVVAQDPKVALTLAEEVLNKLQEYVSNYRTEKSRKDLAYYEQLYKESQAAYYEAQQRYTRWADSNQAVTRQSVLVEGQRLQNEMNLQFNLYNSCAQNVQMAKAQVQMETPVYAVINPPTQPNEPSKPSKLKTLVIFIFLGGAIACVWVLWGRDLISKFKLKEEEDEENVNKE